MKIGTVTEIKNNEYRVGLTPGNVRDYIKNGHEVYVQAGAGEGSSLTDEEYREAGATLLDTAQAVWATCDMIIKVKEPLAAEYPLIRENQIIYTYLHLAADKTLTEALLASKCKAVAYETIRDSHGGLPLLKPMSEVAGKLSVQAGARCLEKPMGGRGVLLGGTTGVRRGDCVIIGGGIVGTAALKMALGLGARVTILDNNVDRLSYLDDLFANRIQTLYSTPATIESAVAMADLVIGAVLVPGAAAPKLIKREYLKTMRPGSVIVDVAVDQGGCCETTRPTFHDNPTYVVDGVIHYGVANMPSAVSRTSTFALTNSTLGYGLKIAGMGLEKAIATDSGLKLGVNCYKGYLTCQEVARDFDMQYTNIDSLGLV
ncbi:MAG: alanine dehydrogenase [Defluviitaleaceae bacterium]|nr:alanine dehydrogenase [Defluviitaleaceae bacterium]